MNLEELRSVQDAERRKSGLQPLRESFYAEAGEYIADLKEERERAADRADDPFSSTEVRQLSDEIETAEEVLEAIYERRMGKLLKRASLSAADMSVDEEGLTNEERELFHDLVDRITDNKKRVLDTLAGNATDADLDAGSGSRSSDARPASDADRSPDAPAADPAPGDTSPATDPGDFEASDHARSTERESPPSEHESPSSGGESPAAGGDGTAVDAASAMGSGDDSSGPDHHEVAPDPAPGGEPIPPEADSDGDSAGVPGDEKRGDGGTRATDSGPTGDTSAGPDPEAGTGADADRSGASTGDADRVTLRITSDVGPIYGVDDREYDLSSEDVVTLPEANAQPLVERDAAEQLDG